MEMPIRTLFIFQNKYGIACKNSKILRISQILKTNPMWNEANNINYPLCNWVPQGQLKGEICCDFWMMEMSGFVTDHLTAISHQEDSPLPLPFPII